MKRKNKLYGFLAMLALSVAMGACTSDPDSAVEPPVEPVETAEPGYFAINATLSPGRSVTRAETTEEGLWQENIIHEVWVLLYSRNAAGNGYDNAVTENDVLQYAYKLEVTNDNFIAEYPDAPKLTSFFEPESGGKSENPKGLSTLVTQGIMNLTTRGWEVDAKNYYLVVLANPSTFLSGAIEKFTQAPYSEEELGEGETFEGQEIYQLKYLVNITGTGYVGSGRNDPMTIEDYIGNTSEEQPKNFFMSNANGLVPVKPEDLKGSKEEAERNPIPVNIDRGLAKVIVQAGSPDVINTTTFPGGKVTHFGWSLINTNQYSYVYRRYANYSGNSTKETYDTSIYSGQREFIYATDPNFTKNQQDPDNLQAEGGRNVQWLDWVWDDTENNYVLPEANYSQFVYALENTLALDAQQDSDWEDYVTQAYMKVTIKFDAIPDEGYFSWNADAADPNGNWRVFSLAQAKEWRNSGDYPTGLEGLETLIGNGNTDGTSSFFNSASTDWEISNYITLAGDHVIDDEATANKIYFHPNGLNEYWVPIKHFNPASADRSRYGQYGIVRNNVYKLNVTAIHGPGVPEKRYTAMAVAITIQPWFVREQDAELVNPRN